MQSRADVRSAKASAQALVEGRGRVNAAKIALGERGRRVGMRGLQPPHGQEHVLGRLVECKGRHGRRRWALLVRHSPMMAQPAARFSRQCRAALCLCTSPRRRCAYDFAGRSGCPFDRGILDQSRNRRDAAEAGMASTAVFLREGLALSQAHALKNRTRSDRDASPYTAPASSKAGSRRTGTIQP